MEYCDEILHTHWYWQYVAEEITKWHLSSVEALTSSKVWKSETGLICWTEWNIVMKFCVHIDIEKMSITLNRLEYFDKILYTHWYWQDIAEEIVILDWPRRCRGLDSEKGKIALSLELSGILHDPKKVNWNWRLTFIVCPIIKHLILSPACSRKISITLKRFGIFW